MKRSNNRLRFLYILMLTISLLVVVNVFFVVIGKVHIRSGTSLINYIQSVSNVEEKIFASRGNIYDRNGNLVSRDKYDFMGRVVRSAVYNKDGNETDVYEYIFTDGGDKPGQYSYKKYEYAGSALQSYTITTYYKEGLPDNVYEYGADGALIGATLYE